MSEWQPIETAPKKTRVIVASATERDRQAIAYLYQIVEGGLWRWWSYDSPLHFAPTHWQPLPAPPPASPAQDGGGE